MSLQYYSVLPSSDLLHRTLWLCLQYWGTLLLESLYQTHNRRYCTPLLLLTTAGSYCSYRAFLMCLVSDLTNTTAFHCDPWSRKIKRKKCSKMWWYNCFKFGWVRGFLWALDRLLSGRMWKRGGGIMVSRAASFFPSCSSFSRHRTSLFILLFLKSCTDKYYCVTSHTHFKR